MIRQKEIISGDLLEVDFSPILDNGRKMPTRATKAKISTEAQEKYNKAKAKKRLIRLVNTNFSRNDYYLHLTFSPDKEPKSYNEAKKRISNFLRRVNRYRKKALKEVEKEINEIKAELAELPNSKYLKEHLSELEKKCEQLNEPFKYIYVIEKARLWHYHLFISGGLSSDELARLWPEGARVKAERYNPDMFGLEAAAAYMAKAPQGQKMYICSKNLKQPTEKIKDGIITRRGLARIASSRFDDAEYWERKHKGYRFVRSYPRFNTYTPNAK